MRCAEKRLRTSSPSERSLDQLSLDTVTIAKVKLKVPPVINPYRAFRQLERKIFRGVPETPESMYERNFSSHVPERLTGRSQFAGGLPIASIERFPVIAVVTYSPATGLISTEHQQYLPFEN